jgi:hypothetical protein
VRALAHSVRERRAGTRDGCRRDDDEPTSAQSAAWITIRFLIVFRKNTRNCQCLLLIEFRRKLADRQRCVSETTSVRLRDRIVCLRLICQQQPIRFVFHQLVFRIRGEDNCPGKTPVKTV